MDMGYSLNSILWKRTELRQFYDFSVLLRPTRGTYVNATYHNNFWLVLYFYLAFQETISNIKEHVCDDVTHKCIFRFNLHVRQFYFITLNRDIISWYSSFIRLIITVQAQLAQIRCEKLMTIIHSLSSMYFIR